MTAFAVSAALLAAAALALLLRPLWSRRRAAAATQRELGLAVFRDQLRELDADLAAGTLARADYDRARQDLERRLLEEQAQETRAAPRARAFPRAGAVSVAVALPLVAIAVYLGVGNLRALDPEQRAGAPPGLRQIEEMVQRLADRLQQNPDDIEGWRMLGRSYTVMGRFAEAANAYAKAAARSPRDPQLLADLADALAMARGHKMAGEPEELVLRALQIDPNNLKALALAGTAAFERNEFRGAVRYWERMLAHVPEDSEDARTIRSNIDEARAQLAQKPGAAKKGTAPAAAPPGVSGTVSLSPRLAAQAAPDDTVFIFARAADGPPMPLAAVRKNVRDLPAQFTLDDSMAMNPQRKLSAFPKVVIVARVSKGGTPAAQPGDLQGMSAPVASNAKGVTVTIDSALP